VFLCGVVKCMSGGDVERSGVGTFISGCDMDLCGVGNCLGGCDWICLEWVTVRVGVMCSTVCG
jgi:hypothetical protein